LAGSFSGFSLTVGDPSKNLRLPPGATLGQATGVDVDSRGNVWVFHRGRVLVADRSNARVQVFDASGKFLDQWQSEEIGRPYAAAAGGEHRVWHRVCC
jgi:hypothetical protein